MPKYQGPCPQSRCKALEVAVSRIFKQLLICSICLAIPEYFQFNCCISGHVVCDTCLHHLSVAVRHYCCPVCKRKSPLVRNTSLANVARELEAFGVTECRRCSRQMPCHRVKSHMAERCSGRSMYCPPCGGDTQPNMFLEHIRDSCPSFNFVRCTTRVALPELPSAADQMCTTWVYIWDFKATDSKSSFALVLNEEFPRAQALTFIPTTVWVSLVSLHDLVYLRVRVFAEDRSDNANNFTKVRQLNFTLKVYSSVAMMTFDYSLQQFGPGNKALITLDQLRDVFKVVDWTELNFSLQAEGYSVDDRWHLGRKALTQEEEEDA